MVKTTPIEAVHINIQGVVQGVGFRPFVYQLANKYHLKGWVCNTSEGVNLEVEGTPEDISQFLEALPQQSPPRAIIETIQVNKHAPYFSECFEIKQSIPEEGKYQLISPDIATCPECLNDILAPDNRRYRYPFTNCTNCGPRFTIIQDIPYDRPKTTMRRFRMCPECQREYEDPADRRFHAQPNACPVCGPRLQLLDANGKMLDVKDPIAAGGRLLKQGKIIAIKGLGGFLLACDATADSAIKMLRQRKNRPFKPLAIMLANIKEVRKYCYVNVFEEDLLISPASPIVLLKCRPDCCISSWVAPNVKYLGIMLPYTPLHHILMKEAGIPLVMTSGNLSEEPIAKDNDEAIRRLSGIADYFLVHNRDIYARYDDSVTMVERGVPQLVRRARGYAPYPIHLTFNSKQILACGAELKNTFCLTRDNHAFLSQHIGDMENLETTEHYENTIELYKKLFRIEPEIIAHDLHPDYLATRYAKEIASKLKDIKLVPVQHHHAHVVSCMADNGIESPVIGVALDGTGLGTDGNIWGGEFMVADYKEFKRLGHFDYLPLPGGEAAIKKPYRIAIGYITSLLGESALAPDLPFLEKIDRGEIDIIKRQIERKINSPLTSSCGRLFDAVSALIGVRGTVEYEAQAAIELEMLAYEAMNETGSYPFTIVEQDGINLIKMDALFSSIIFDLKRNIPKPAIAARFHNTVAEMLQDMCQIISTKTHIKNIALTGGVFQNRLLLGKSISLLENDGFKVFTHRQVPTNDGGISLGQAVVANYAN